MRLGPQCPGMGGDINYAEEIRSCVWGLHHFSHFCPSYPPPHQRPLLPPYTPPYTPKNTNPWVVFSLLNCLFKSIKMHLLIFFSPQQSANERFYETALTPMHILSSPLLEKAWLFLSRFDLLLEAESLFTLHTTSCPPVDTGSWGVGIRP